MSVKITELDQKLTACVAADLMEITDSASVETKSISPELLLQSGFPLKVGGLTVEGTTTRLTIKAGPSTLMVVDGADPNQPWISGSGAGQARLQTQILPSKPTYASAGDTDTGLSFPAANAAAIYTGGKESARFGASTSAVNYAEVTAADTGEPVSVAAAGSDSDVDLKLSPKGAGKVRIGSVTAATTPANFVATHYIELADESGTAFWMPVTVGGPW